MHLRRYMKDWNWSVELVEVKGSSMDNRTKPEIKLGNYEAMDKKTEKTARISKISNLHMFIIQLRCTFSDLKLK